jgi:hypothetical protein
LTTSPAYSEHPGIAIGGGLQAGMRGPRNGILFMETRFMYYIKDAVLKNEYKDIFPHPSAIHYRHFTFGVGVGYKLGFFDRK